VRTPSGLKSVYDFVIVGAGSAGCVMANRLSADPDIDVLLLEAGGRNSSLYINMPAALSIPMNRPRFNWGYRAEPDPGLDDRRLDCPRGRGLGGSSAINGMVYVRGHARDFEGWDRLCGSDGNWSYAAVLPYFKRAERCLDAEVDERYRGRAGPLSTTSGQLENPLYERFLAAAEEAGYHRSDDLNGFRQEGVGPLPMTVAAGIRCSAARAYLLPVLQRPNLDVVTDAIADRLNFDNHRATTLIWQAGGRQQTIRARREIILSAGAIESPCILQRSGLGPARWLEPLGIRVLASLPAGENLMDHLEVYVQQACRPDLSLNPSLSLAGKAAIGARWLLSRTGPGATNHFETGGFIRSAAGIEWPDVQFHFLPAAMNYDGSEVSAAPGYQLHVGPMLPESRGSVSIRSRVTGPHPRIAFNYLSDERDVAAFRRCIELSREILAQRSLREISGAELEPGAAVRNDAEVDAWIRRQAQSAYHPCGTCAMGESGVVDGDGRVHGVDGLRVVDASIFPMITNGNLNAPTIMIAEKIAATITGQTLAPDPQPFHIAPDWRTCQR